MATVGVQSYTIGLLDDKGQLIKDEEKGLSANGIFTADASTALGVTQANITGLTATMQKVFGSDQVTDNQLGIPQPQAVLSTNNLPYEVYNKVVGREKDPTTGGFTSYTKALPDSALLVTTRSVGTLKKIHIAFFHGNVAPGELNLQTNNTNESRAIDQLTFSANTRVKDGANYKIYYEDEEGFDEQKMLAEVFPGYSEAIDSETETPKTISLTPTAVTVEAGKTADLGINLTGLASQEVTFAPADASIATAALDSASGKYQVTGVAVGTTKITVASKDDPTVTADVDVTVTAHV
ncbi:phage tail protein [Lactobacillus acetotolerans]|uniref:phage tail protein n=1 Tax=Lactobacillus acetotolerans TaxID=1600 RepID=UPI002FD8EE41